MKKNKITISIFLTLIIVFVAGWKLFFKNDFIYVFKLWFTLLLIGGLFFPLTSSIFKKFHDRGWFFSKIIGVTISSWLMWILSYSKVFEYSTFNSYLIIGVLAIANIVFFIIKFKKNTNKNNKNKNATNNINTSNNANTNINSSFKLIDLSIIKNILLTELIFIICLTFWIYIKGINPAITNCTEQFMDYGFMNSIMNSKFMPPEDIWHSGTHINYYYFGQYWSGFICKIANLNVNEGYNLINAFIASCTFVMPYVIGFNLFKNKFRNKKRVLQRFLTYLLAIIMGLGISLGGTLHYPIYRWFDDSKENYFYTDETRFIGYKPDTNDKAVTEKPVYSSVLGDLHAQYIVLVFSFTVIALLLEYFLSNKKQNIKKSLLDPCFILIAFLFGIQKMTNYWDFPIYMVIIAAFVVTKNLICKKFTLRQVLKTLLILAELIIIEELITLPFSADLYVSGTNVFFTDRTSPFYKFAILWGLQIICVALFFILFFWNFRKSKTQFKKYLVNNSPDLFNLIIGLCAIGLVILPEIVYLKDIYGDEYQRFNTMFKLTYEAFILFGICINYIIFNFFTKKYKSAMALGLILLTINISTFGYGIDTIITNYTNNEYLGISASESFLKENLESDYIALQWIKENISTSKVLLEASNIDSSYTTTSRMSVFTGNPTVLGWMVHEWLWRCNSDYSMPEELSVRYNDIKEFYTGDNYNKAREFINKYNISYIYVGELEYDSYPDLNIEFLKNLGNIVYENTTSNFKTTYIIDVQNL